MAEAVGEDDVGRAGWLWLTRPEGWHDELAALEADESARAADAAEQREERAATRRLAATEAALARAEGAASALARGRRGPAVRPGGRAGRPAGRRVPARRRRRRGRGELATERRDAVRSLKDTEVRLVERGTQLNAARARIKALEAELRAATPPGEARPRAARGAGPVRAGRHTARRAVDVGPDRRRPSPRRPRPRRRRPACR